MYACGNLNIYIYVHKHVCVQRGYMKEYEYKKNRPLAYIYIYIYANGNRNILLPECKAQVVSPVWHFVVLCIALLPIFWGVCEHWCFKTMSPTALLPIF